MFSNDKTIEIKILIIGFAEYFDSIKKSLLQFPNLRPAFLPLDSYAELEDIMKSFPADYEVILFTDSKLAETFKNSRPDFYEYAIHALHTNELNLFIHYYSIVAENPAASLSMDFPSLSVQNRVLQSISSEEVHAKSAAASTIKELVSFHQENSEKDGSIVVTSAPLVWRELRKRGIDAKLALPHHTEIMLTLERAVLSSPTRQSRETQPVIFIIELADFPSSALPLIRNELNSYKKRLNGILYKTGTSTFHLITNFGTFENVSRGYKKVHLLDNLHAEKEVTVKIGIGLGKTHAISLYNAVLALNQAKNRKGDTCYIAREDKSIFGPIEPNRAPVYEKYSLSIKNDKFIELANEFQMSAVYLSKLLGRLQAEDKLSYTSEELAITLNITMRSANRILLNWLDAGLISIVGEEKAKPNGRPRRLYHFDFLKDQVFT